MLNLSSRKVLCTALGCLLTLSACNGGGGEGGDRLGSGSKALTLSFKNEGENNQATATFISPDGEQPIGPNVTIPLYTDIGEDSIVSTSLTILPPDKMGRYREHTPHPELLCEQPSDTALADIASQLGGYKKGVQIYVEPDAATPTLLDGIEPLPPVTIQNDSFFVSDSANPIANSANSTIESASAPASVDIQRPNLVVRSTNKAFFLSRTYGLIVVDFSDTVNQTVKTSCALPLPGQAINLLSVGDDLFVLLRSIDGRHSGIIRFSLSDTSNTAPAYTDSLFFENQRLLDARRFNETLAIFLERYDIKQHEAVNAAGENYTYTTQTLENYQLKIIDTQPSMNVEHTQVFNYSLDTEADPVSSDRWSSFFNKFLSASGEYLVVSETKTHRYISHYETRYSNRCTKHEQQEKPYRYCSINWKRIENPDYIAPSTSGIINCSGNLLSCIRTKLPTASRYIHIPDGETCHSGVRTLHICVAWRTERYEVPVHAYDDYTHFHVFRFDGTTFHKLDDTLATLDGQDIQVSDAPFEIRGRIQKHDHLYFKNDQFYAISKDGENARISTLAIIGNAALITDTQTLNKTGRYNELSASFTDTKIYLSEAGYSIALKRYQSDIHSFSLDNPLKPVLERNFALPTRLDQLLTSDYLLLGVGGTYAGNSPDRNYVGTVTAFGASGTEIKSLLLGSDYRNYSSAVSYDDQAITFDQSLDRLFVPYRGYSPLSLGSTAPVVNRLTIASATQNELTEEHTFSLPETPQRTLSISSPLALSFDDEYIHKLVKNDAWQAEKVFDGNLPDSIYYSRNHPTHVQKVIHNDRFEFKLVDGKQGASGELLDNITTPRSPTSNCFYEQVYFDQDRILVAQEKPGVYFSYEDCPKNRQDTEKLLTGYRIGSNQLTEIEDQQELQQLLQLAQWNLVCITDIGNESGKRINILPNGVNELSCYTPSQYNELRYPVEDQVMVAQ